MKIEKKLVEDTLTVFLEGRLDLNTAPEFEKEVEISDAITRLVIDFEKLEYISSAGIRVILAMQDVMSDHGKMILRNMSEEVREVFDITGLSEELNIE